MVHPVIYKSCFNRVEICDCYSYDDCDHGRCMSRIKWRQNYDNQQKVGPSKAVENDVLYGGSRKTEQLEVRETIPKFHSRADTENKKCR